MFWLIRLRLARVFARNGHVCYVDPDGCCNGNKGEGHCYVGKPTAVKALSAELAA